MKRIAPRNPLYEIIDSPTTKKVKVIGIDNPIYKDIIINEKALSVVSAHISILNDNPIRSDNKEYHITLVLFSESENKHYKLRGYYNKNDIKNSTLTFKTYHPNKDIPNEELSLQSQESPILKQWLHSIAHQRLLPLREQIHTCLNKSYIEHNQLNQHYLRLRGQLKETKEISQKLYQELDQCIQDMKHEEKIILRFNPQWTNALADTLAFDFAIINQEYLNSQKPKKTSNKSDNLLAKKSQPQAKPKDHSEESIYTKKALPKSPHENKEMAAIIEMNKIIKNITQYFQRTAFELYKVERSLSSLYISKNLYFNPTTPLSEEILSKIRQHTLIIRDYSQSLKPKKKPKNKKWNKKKANSTTCYDILLKSLNSKPSAEDSADTHDNIETKFQHCFDTLNPLMKTSFEKMLSMFNRVKDINISRDCMMKNDLYTNAYSRAELLDSLTSLEEEFFIENFKNVLEDKNNILIEVLIQYSSHHAKKFLLYAIDNNLPHLIELAANHIINQIETPIDEKGLSALGYALKNDKPECFKALLKIGANIFSPYKHELPIAYYALSEIIPSHCSKSLITYAGKDSFITLFTQLINQLEVKLKSEELPKKIRQQLHQDIEFFKVYAGTKYNANPIIFFNSTLAKTVNYHKAALFNLQSLKTTEAEAIILQLEEQQLNNDLLFELRIEFLKFVREIYQDQPLFKKFNMSIPAEYRNVSMSEMSSIVKEEMHNYSNAHTFPFDEKASSTAEAPAPSQVPDHSTIQMIDNQIDNQIVSTLCSWKLLYHTTEIQRLVSSQEPIRKRQPFSFFHQIEISGEKFSSSRTSMTIYKNISDSKNFQVIMFVAREIDTHGFGAFDICPDNISLPNSHDSERKNERISHLYTLMGIAWSGVSSLVNNLTQTGLKH
ncbi:MAG TPA: hypothetical protein QF353_06360 [Gammaproteobacteria bacterium]|nr:hypothetical protein [Gammaproteobacteria bacterium]